MLNWFKSRRKKKPGTRSAQPRNATSEKPDEVLSRSLIYASLLDEGRPENLDRRATAGAETPKPSKVSKGDAGRDHVQDTDSGASAAASDSDYSSSSSSDHSSSSSSDFSSGASFSDGGGF